MKCRRPGSASAASSTGSTGPRSLKSGHTPPTGAGAELPASAEQGSGLGAGKVKFNEFAFKMPSSLASASCFKNMYKGTHIPAATLYLRKAGGGQKDYMTFSFKELMINKYAIDGGSEDPVEDITFGYTAMYFVYNQQKQDGSLGDKRDAGWDVKQNVEWIK